MDGTDGNTGDRARADLRHALEYERSLIAHLGSNTDLAGRILLQGWTTTCSSAADEAWVVDVFLRSPDHHHGLTVAVHSPVPSRHIDLGLDLDTYAMFQASGAVERYFTRTPSEDEALRYVTPL